MMTREDKRWLVELAKQVAVVIRATPEVWSSYQSADMDKAFARFLPKEPAKLITKNLEDAEDKAFVQGFGMAVGALARDHDEPSQAADIMRSNGITFKQLRAAGVEEFDLRCLRSEFKK